MRWRAERSTAARGSRLALCGVDPGERHDHPDHQQEEDKLDSNRQPDQPPCPARASTALLAVSRVRHERGAALVASLLDLIHAIEYATSVVAVGECVEPHGARGDRL